MRRSLSNSANAVRNARSAFGEAACRFSRGVGGWRRRFGGLAAEGLDGGPQPLHVLNLNGNLFSGLYQGVVADGAMDMPVFAC
jgi:hypothetical protein